MSDSFVNTFVSSTMSIDLSRTKMGPQRIADLCTDLLLIAIRMRDAEDLGEPAALRELILHYLGLFESNCKLAGIQPEAIEDVRYAVVALLDETTLSIPGRCRDYWLSQPLQLELFGEAMAGEVFYQRLKRLMPAPRQNRDVLEVFYLCLALGFEGKYRLGGSTEREGIIKELGSALASSRKEGTGILSPHGVPPSVKPTQRATWRDAAVSILPVSVAVLAVVVTWLGLSLANAAEFGSVMQSIETVLWR